MVKTEIRVIVKYEVFPGNTAPQAAQNINGILISMEYFLQLLLHNKLNQIRLQNFIEVTLTSQMSNACPTKTMLVNDGLKSTIELDPSESTH